MNIPESDVVEHQRALEEALENKERSVNQHTLEQANQRHTLMLTSSEEKLTECRSRLSTLQSKEVGELTTIADIQAKQLTTEHLLETKTQKLQDIKGVLQQLLSRQTNEPSTDVDHMLAAVFTIHTDLKDDIQKVRNENNELKEEMKLVVYLQNRYSNFPNIRKLII